MYDRLCEDKKLRRRRLFWLSSDELFSLFMILLLGRSCSAILIRELWLINFIIGQRHQKDSKNITVNAFPIHPNLPSLTKPSFILKPSLFILNYDIMTITLSSILVIFISTLSRRAQSLQSTHQFALTWCTFHVSSRICWLFRFIWDEISGEAGGSTKSIWFIFLGVLLNLYIFSCFGFEVQVVIRKTQW